MKRKAKENIKEMKKTTKTIEKIYFLFIQFS